MHDSKLHDLGGARGRSGRGNQPRAAALLHEAWVALERAKTSPDANLHVIESALPALDLPMDRENRMLAFYLLGSAFLGGGALRTGVDYFEMALDLAEELDDLPTQVELAYQLGVVTHNAALFAAAANYLTMALTRLETFQEHGGAAEPAFELSLRLGLGTCHYMLEDYERALDHLAAARALALDPQLGLQQASCDWITALVYRWQGAPELAVHYALRAAEAYGHDTSRAATLSLGRLQAVVADISLDLAERYAADFPHDARTAWVRLAQPYAQRALNRAHLAQDRMGEAIARLARARWERLAGRNTDRESAIDALIRLGHREHDAPLIAQAYTAMGMELADQGLIERARNCFRTALDAVGPSQSPAMGRWARVALLKDLPNT